MPFARLEEHCPDLAHRETRTIVVAPGSDSGVPPDQYCFDEYYCNEPGCDCRRVFLGVRSVLHRRTVAEIGFGWEDAAFYAAWLGDGDPEDVAETKGPALNGTSPASVFAPALLELARRLLFADPRYVEQLRRHYVAFRREVEKAAAAAPRAGRRPGRNENCPCGSGRKWKRCCGRVDGPKIGVEERWLSQSEMRVQQEVDYIIGRARERRTHVVDLGPIRLFSTSSGDAWLLDPADRSAVPLARDGDRCGARILEGEEKFVIEWTHDYEVDGETFVVVERETGRELRITGYGRDLLERLEERGRC